jgi:non-ribosomal peptide synthetase component F
MKDCAQRRSGNRMNSGWNMFSGNIPVLSVPTDYTRTASVSFKGERVAFETGNDLAHELNRIARESGTTLYMVLLAGYNVLLHKYSGQSDIVIGSPIAGRPHADLENIVGMFVNTLPMRNYPHQNKTFKEFLEGVKDNALKAYENQDSQMDEIIDKLNLKKLPGRNLLFDTMFILQNMSAKEVNLQGLRFIKP